MIIIEGDLLNAPFQVIAHQVNCMGVMGAGVAKSLRLKYPGLYESYKEMCSLYERNRKDLLGLCHWYRAVCIAIPYGIGCGLAGGDWSEVKEILEKIEQDENVLFFAYRLY